MKKKRIFVITAVCVVYMFSSNRTCLAKGRWCSGSDAWSKEEWQEIWQNDDKETMLKKGQEKPIDANGNCRNELWYAIDYCDEENSLIKSRYMGTYYSWIDEDKNGNRDGLFHCYNLSGTYPDGLRSGFLATNYDAGNGKYFDEEGIFTVNGEILTISERPGVEGTFRGLWPGVYWDQYHQSRIEVDTEETIRYYEYGKELPSMI
ncbi:MAG: hypothetical protein HFE84_00380 [Lachnospiraceae bacterium]|nr:hypothetical protein [Lachnospiraceae bacterium]